MNRPDFDKCTVEATKLLYKQDVSNLILNIQNLVFDKNIIFESLQNYCQLTHRPLSDFLSNKKQLLYDGCTLYIPEYDYYIVLYNASIRCFEHLNWTLAHEIGHIYLGHTKDDDIDEVEAHYFAFQLFMPEYTLFMIAHTYGKVTVNAITEIFGVSETAARKRINTMNKRTCFYATEKDKQIWKCQKERVEIYYDCLKTGMNFKNMYCFWQEMKADYERQARLEAYVNAY